MSWTRLVLKDEESRSQLATLAAQSQWYIDEVIQAGEGRPFELVYVDERDDALISYIEDGQLGLALALVRGEDHEEVAARIREKVSVVTREYVLAAARGAKTGMDQVKAAYLAAGSASSEFDPELYDAIECAARSEDAQARHGALLAMAYTEWPECRALLAELSRDADDSVRHVAGSMLAAWPTA